MRKRSLMIGIACLAAMISVGAASAEEISLLRREAVARPAQAPASSTKWIAIAVSPDGRAFKSGEFSTEEGARSAAVNECQAKTARTCPRGNTRSVPIDWDVVGLKCGGAIFISASGPEHRRAAEYAYDSARSAGHGSAGCTVVANY